MNAPSNRDALMHCIESTGEHAIREMNPGGLCGMTCAVNPESGR